jgi:DNA-binding GntR family transcriptional regulator
MPIQSKKSHRTVEPIADLATIDRLRTLLSNRPRDLLLFEMAIRTGMGMKELLQLKVEQLTQLKIDDPLPARSSRATPKAKPLMGRRLWDVFQRYMEKTNPSPGDYVFSSRKGFRPLSLTSASHLVKSWFVSAGVNGLPGAKSLQKTWEIFFKERGRKDLKPEEENEVALALRPLKTLTVQEQVYQELFRAIVSGRIHPGERLVTGNIAKRMQVSQMPVREALHRLGAAGFLSAQRSRGMVVNELSNENLGEITRIRLILEPMAAKHAALLRSTESLRRLATLQAEFVQAHKKHEVDRFLSLNRKFHRTIYQEANMPILLQIIDGLWARVSPYLHILMREGQSKVSKYTISTHQGMLEGMISRNAQQVVTCLKTDLTNAARALMDMFNRLRVVK